MVQLITAVIYIPKMFMKSITGRADSLEELSQVYRDYLADFFFYLSFENSDHCVDYVTEKFYFALNSSAVPVVFG